VKIYVKSQNIHSNLDFAITTAIIQWKVALGIDIEIINSEDLADIVIQELTEPEFLTLIANDPEKANWIGHTEIDEGNGLYFYDTNTQKEVKEITHAEISLRGSLGIRLNHVILHELGHALGFLGHASSETAVMHTYSNNITLLTAADKVHLQQIYNIVDEGRQ